MKIVAVMFMTAAALAGLSAMVHGLWSLAHLNRGISPWRMLFQGIRWFDEDNFTPRGKQLQRRFLRWLGISFGCALAVAMASALAGK